MSLVGYSNLIFDLDGTLVDSLPGIEVSLRSAISKVLPKEEIPEIRKIVGPPLRQMFEKMWPHIPGQLIDEVVREYRRHYDAEGFLKTVLFPEVEKVLGRFYSEKKRIFLLTNKPKLSTGLILHHLKIDHFFEECVSPDSYEPHFIEKADGLCALVKRRGLDLRETLMVGDSVDDGRAAVKTGVDFAAVDYGYGAVSQNPDYRLARRIQCFQDLLASSS